MGGEIGVVSAPGAGSSFWFTARLRCAGLSSVLTASQAAEAAAAQALSSRHGGACVQMVEDEPIGAEIVATLIEEVGLGVSLAEDGEAALRLAREREFDLILMDMQMQRLNGLEATRAIRADSRNRATPIIAMTANAFAQDRERCLAAGVDDRLAKPIMPELLYAGLLAWLSGPCR